mmetsp:Transcript_35905/g.64057  ORF Transcript_35905/g.64057 Transcript_35905/m.64057 type:complete len:299 (+) Transcript_35905:18-914(+)
MLRCNVVFTVYVAFVYFAVLNVVTGVFCHAAIESAQHDQDMVIQQELANRQRYIQKVKQLFEDLDTDSSGTITLTEFESHFQDESVQAYFHSLDLDPKDAWTLFKLLDAHCTHQVDIEEFALGCLRLRGPAKRIDIEKLMYDHQRMLRGLSAFSSLVEHQLQIIAGDTHRLTSNSTVAGRGSVVAARDYLDELKEVARNSPAARFQELNDMPAARRHKKKRTRNRPSVSSRTSSLRGSGSTAGGSQSLSLSIGRGSQASSASMNASMKGSIESTLSPRSEQKICAALYGSSTASTSRS